jgi:hypothetical protein
MNDEEDRQTDYQQDSCDRKSNSLETVNNCLIKLNVNKCSIKPKRLETV